MAKLQGWKKLKHSEDRWVSTSTEPYEYVVGGKLNLGQVEINKIKTWKVDKGSVKKTRPTRYYVSMWDSHKGSKYSKEYPSREAALEKASDYMKKYPQGCRSK
jgi:hypothetical protein